MEPGARASQGHGGTVLFPRGILCSYALVKDMKLEDTFSRAIFQSNVASMFVSTTVASHCPSDPSFGYSALSPFRLWSESNEPKYFSYYTKPFYSQCSLGFWISNWGVDEQILNFY